MTVSRHMLIQLSMGFGIILGTVSRNRLSRDMLIQWCMGLGILGFFWDCPERYAWCFIGRDTFSERMRVQVNISINGYGNRNSCLLSECIWSTKGTSAVVP